MSSAYCVDACINTLSGKLLQELVTSLGPNTSQQAAAAFALNTMRHDIPTQELSAEQHRIIRRGIIRIVDCAMDAVPLICRRGIDEANIFSLVITTLERMSM